MFMLTAELCNLLLYKNVFYFRKDLYMSINNKIHVNADDLVFNAVNEKETAIISKARDKILFQGFKKRAIISVILGIIIAIGECIGRKNQHIDNTIPGALGFIAAAVIIFNLLSFGYIVLKRKMNLYTDKMEVLYCTISEKYNQHKLSRENKKHSQNYILLETDNYYCTTAFPVKNIQEFNKLSIGDTVLLLKKAPFGDVHYEIFTDVNSLIK